MFWDDVVFIPEDAPRETIEIMAGFGAWGLVKGAMSSIKTS